MTWMVRFLKAPLLDGLNVYSWGYKSLFGSVIPKLSKDLFGTLTNCIHSILVHSVPHWIRYFWLLSSSPTNLRNATLVDFWCLLEIKICPRLLSSLVGFSRSMDWAKCYIWTTVIESFSKTRFARDQGSYCGWWDCLSFGCVHTCYAAFLLSPQSNHTV